MDISPNCATVREMAVPPGNCVPSEAVRTAPSGMPVRDTETLKNGLSAPSSSVRLNATVPSSTPGVKLSVGVKLGSGKLPANSTFSTPLICRPKVSKVRTVSVSPLAMNSFSAIKSATKSAFSACSSVKRKITVSSPSPPSTMS